MANQIAVQLQSELCKLGLIRVFQKNIFSKIDFYMIFSNSLLYIVQANGCVIVDADQVVCGVRRMQASQSCTITVRINSAQFA